MKSRLSDPCCLPVDSGRNGRVLMVLGTSFCVADPPMILSMSDPLPFQKPEGTPKGSERRMRGRMLQQGVICNLGIVVDLSSGGMRVMAKRKYQGEVDINIQSFDDTLALHGEVVWTHRAAFRCYMMGVKFLRVDAESLKKLTAIATAHRLREAI